MIMSFFYLFFHLIFIRLLEARPYKISGEYKHEHRKITDFKNSRYFLFDISAERIFTDHNISFSSNTKPTDGRICTV